MKGMTVDKSAGHNTTDNTTFWVVIMCCSSRNFALHRGLSINISVLSLVASCLPQLQNKEKLFELRAAGIHFVVCFRR